MTPDERDRLTAYALAQVKKAPPPSDEVKERVRRALLRATASAA